MDSNRLEDVDNCGGTSTKSHRLDSSDEYTLESSSSPASTPSNSAAKSKNEEEPKASQDSKLMEPPLLSLVEPDRNEDNDNCGEKLSFTNTAGTKVRKLDSSYEHSHRNGNFGESKGSLSPASTNYSTMWEKDIGSAASKREGGSEASRDSNAKLVELDSYTLEMLSSKLRQSRGLKESRYIQNEERQALDHEQGPLEIDPIEIANPEVIEGFNCLDYVEFKVENISSPQTFSRLKAGYKFHFPPNSVASTTTFKIASALTGFFDLPKGTSPVSAFIHVQLTPNVTLNKPATLELSHCCVIESQEQADNVFFARADHESATGAYPFYFEPMFHGEFCSGKRYGTISVSKFSVFTVLRMRLVQLWGLLKHGVQRVWEFVGRASATTEVHVDDDRNVLGAPPTTEVHNDEQPATTEVHNDEQPATTEIHNDEQPATTEVHNDEQPATTEVHDNVQLATTEVHNDEQLATTEVCDNEHRNEFGAPSLTEVHDHKRTGMDLSPNLRYKAYLFMKAKVGRKYILYFELGIVQDHPLSRNALQDHYAQPQCKYSLFDQCAVEFEGKSIVVENIDQAQFAGGWKIQASHHPEICQDDVDNIECSDQSFIGSCTTRFQIVWQPNDATALPELLDHRIMLRGAVPPRNFFYLIHDPLEGNEVAPLQLPSRRSNQTPITLETVINHVGITETLLNEEFSPEYFWSISALLPHWFHLAKALSLGEGVITDISTNHDLVTNRLKANRVLECWHQQNGFRATYSQFLEICLKEGYVALAVSVCRALKDALIVD